MTDKVPSVNRDGTLISRLLALLLGGFDRVLEKESQLYLRLLVRLIDKAFNEYTNARNYLLEEIQTEDKLLYRFEIINHFENCINALSRINKILSVLSDGITIRRKNYPSKSLRKNLGLTKLIGGTLKNLEKRNISAIRNSVEHIERDIYLDKFNEGIFLDIDSKYKKICINNNCVSLHQLSSIIENYHQLVLTIFSNLPNRMQDGKYFYDKR